MTRLGSPFFERWAREMKTQDDTQAYLAWVALRGTCEIIHARRALELKSKELLVLKAALQLCPPCADVDFLNSLTFQERG